MPRPTFLSQIARIRSEMQQKANEIRHNNLIEEANQSLREENLITLTAIITAKAFVNGQVHGPIIKFFDEVYILKTFPGFGAFYGMVTKYEDPYYEVYLRVVNLVNNRIFIYFFLITDCIHRRGL
jgi:hypothetical protein